MLRGDRVGGRVPQWSMTPPSWNPPLPPKTSLATTPVPLRAGGNPGLHALVPGLPKYHQVVAIKLPPDTTSVAAQLELAPVPVPVRSGPPIASSDTVAPVEGSNARNEQALPEMGTQSRP